MTSASEEDVAQWRRAEGQQVVEHDSLFWLASTGFYRRIHFLGETPPESLRRPALDCWGYQTAVGRAAGSEINAWIPLHVVENLQAYDEKAPDKTKRKHIRRARRLFHTGPIHDPNELGEDGWEVFKANRDRLLQHTERWVAWSPTRFRRWAEEAVGNPGRLFTGVYRDDRLVGFMESFALDGTAYFHEIFLEEEATAKGAGTLLYYEVAQAYRRAGRIERLCAGPHLPERSGVTEFKIRMGIPLVRVPGHVWIVPGLSRLFQRRRPLGYYRLTGVPPRKEAS